VLPTVRGRKATHANGGSFMEEKSAATVLSFIDRPRGGVDAPTQSSPVSVSQSACLSGSFIVPENLEKERLDPGALRASVPSTDVVRSHQLKRIGLFQRKRLGYLWRPRGHGGSRSLNDPRNWGKANLHTAAAVRRRPSRSVLNTGHGLGCAAEQTTPHA
jgi:hypothetical protein